METFAPCEMPCASLIGTMKAAWPREPSSRSTVATTTWMSAMPPFVAQAFWPFRTHSPAAASNRALVRSALTSEPAFGSEEQKAATLTSSGVPKQRGTQCPICSGVPWPKTGRHGETGPHDRHADAGVAQKSSSLTSGSVRPLGSARNCVSPSQL